MKFAAAVLPFGRDTRGRGSDARDGPKRRAVIGPASTQNASSRISPVCGGTGRCLSKPTNNKRWLS
jgi:hypothetical protein